MTSKTPRKSISRTKRARVFAAADGICVFCGEGIDGVRDRWEIQHVIPLGLGGEDEESNMAPAHHHCHRQHTAKSDIPQIAKAKRVAAKHTGAHRARKPLPGSRDSEWKRKMDGTWERRKP